MKKLILFLIITLSSLFAVDATMEIIKKGKTIPKIVVNLASDSDMSRNSRKLKELLKSDLSVSGHFNVRDYTFNLQFGKKPNVRDLRALDVDLFANIFVALSPLGGYELYVKLYDINSNKLVQDKTFSVSTEERYPFLAHKAAIDMNTYLGAPSIGWMEKFVIFSRYQSARQSEILISDYTLTYQQIIVKGGLNIFPKWASSIQEEFYYTAYVRGVPTIYKYNLYSGEKTKIISSDGMAICSDVSEDGKKLLLVLAPNAQPDIYLYNTDNRIKRRLTFYKGIDVGATFINNDQRFSFVSNRLGYPNIFAKTIGDRGVERLIYHGKNNNSCSSHDNYIVYTSRETKNEFGSNTFNLYLASTESEYLRRLTTVGVNQFPKFSSDGESILFIKSTGSKSSLGIIRLFYNKSFLFPLKVGKLQSIDW
jgi:TolB protein